MKLQHLALGLLLVPVAVTGAHAGAEKVGTTAANFLSLGAGADILGRGGATLALGGDINAVGWNAGALAWLGDTRIALSHATLLDEHQQEYLAAGGRVLGSELRWSLSGLYESNGAFEGRDASNNPTGSYNLSSFAGGGHLAYPIGGFLAVGVGAKWVSENLGVSQGSGAAIDAGVQVRAGFVSFGAAAQNAFGRMRFASESYEFPTNYGVGFALQHPTRGVRVAVDANFPTAYYNDVRGGVEWSWRDLATLRAGYRAELGAPQGDVLSGPTFGAGAGIYGVWLDYGYLISTGGEGQHRLGLSLRSAGRAPRLGDPFGQNAMPTEFGPERDGRADGAAAAGQRKK